MRVRKLLKLSAQCLLGAACLFVAALLIVPNGYYLTAPNPTLLATLNDNQPPPSQQGFAGVGSFVINLARSPVRLAYVMPTLDALGYPVTRVDAVDGKALSQQTIESQVDTKLFRRTYGKNPKLGAIGCSLSHLRAWQQFLKTNYAFGLIFEDDVTFSPETLQQIVEELTLMPSDWDVVSFDICYDGHPTAIATLATGHDLSVHKTKVACAGAYLINRSAAEQLVANALPLKMIVDDYYVRGWEHQYQFLGIESPRVVSQAHGSSDLLATDNFTKAPRSPLEHFQRLSYRVQTNLMRLKYAYQIKQAHLKKET